MIRITVTIEENNGIAGAHATYTPKKAATELELDILRTWRLEQAGGPIKAAVLELLEGSGAALDGGEQQSTQ